ncbi:MAG: DtxR family transcriptional regulator [Chloroflexi bacterium]|nr:MAG: DtxR family transcriptional regulator [Chloroflexota bacterium]PIE79605.1 MAG: DtxR family transcriptional regulator [Chloroflexota bacterium]
MRTNTTSNETIEMYLKTIAELSDGRTPVVIARVAERLGVTPVSANEMMKRLMEQGLITHERYKGVNLTDNGRTYAYNVIRRQRLWECFLVEHLKIDWAAVYEISCRLEHATSNVLAEALSAYLDHPTICPHGRAIPRPDGTLPKEIGQPLTELSVGQSGVIDSIQPTTTDIFAYLNRHQILPDCKFKIVEVAPMDGPIMIELDAGRVALGQSMAELIFVRTQ